VGEGEGKPGQGKGEFSLKFDLQNQILVRKNRAEYPAANGRPAFTHEDLMIIYPGTGGQRNQAIYFDSEGHVIRYTVSAAEPGNDVTFIGEAAPAAPRFRLTYKKMKADTVSLVFEIAPPGKPDEFKTYIEATVRRKVKPGAKEEE
jgi:hypothetical protein